MKYTLPEFQSAMLLQPADLQAWADLIEDLTFHKIDPEELHWMLQDYVRVAIRANEEVPDSAEGWFVKHYDSKERKK